MSFPAEGLESAYRYLVIFSRCIQYSTGKDYRREGKGVSKGRERIMEGERKDYRREGKGLRKGKGLYIEGKGKDYRREGKGL